MNSAGYPIRLKVTRQLADRSNYFFFLLWPAVAFFKSIFELHHASSRVVVVLFFGLCGYFYPFTFTDNVDIVRHANQFLEVSGKPFSEFITRATSLYENTNYKPDLFQGFIEFVVSRVTTNYRIYFAILGILLGMLLAKLARIYNAASDSSRDRFAFAFVLFLFLLITPYRIAGFRHFLATLLFIYACHKAIVEQNHKYNVIILLTSLVHFGFLGFLPFFFLRYVFRHAFVFYFLLIGLAIALQDVAPTYLGNLSEGLQGELQSRVAGYSSERYIEYIGEIKANRNIFIDNQIRWTCYFFFVSLAGIHNAIRKTDDATKSLYAVSLSIFAFLMLVSNLETTFVRFSIVYILLACLIYLRLMAHNSFHMGWVYKYAVSAVLLFNLIIATRKTIEYTGIQSVLPNPVVSVFVDMNLSVLDLLK